MPLFKWSSVDFIQCLGVVPEVEEYDISHTFTVMKDEMRLVVKVRQFDGDVDIALFRDGCATAIVDCRIAESDAARWVNDSRGNYIEIGGGRLFGGRYDGDAPIPYGARIRVEPGIQIEFFRVRE